MYFCFVVGTSLKAERSTVDDVRERFRQLKRKQFEVVEEEYDFEEKLRLLRQSEVKRRMSLKREKFLIFSQEDKRAAKRARKKEAKKKKKELEQQVQYCSTLQCNLIFLHFYLFRLQDSADIATTPAVDLETLQMAEMMGLPGGFGTTKQK